MKQATFIILGATGDLAKRKLIPALYELIEEKKIDKVALLGVAHSKATVKSMLAAARPHIRHFKSAVWNKLKKVSYYQQADFSDPKAFEELKTTLESIERKHKLSNRVFYLSVSPQFFAPIAKQLSRTKLAKQSAKRWCRLLFEKPFGDDLTSAKKLNRSVNLAFKENQIYRVDHFLGKELVGGISIVRFTNRVLEPLWNNKHIEQVQILMPEKFGVRQRGAFYDKYGALKDVVQNHILQLLALVAMEPPAKLTGEHVRNAKAQVLKRTKVESVMLGQYTGYRKAKGVSRTSKTETFAALKLSINTPRWKGVPFFVKAGKGLNVSNTSIHLKFKEVECLLSKACPSDTNYFSIQIDPDDGFKLEVNSKVPGKETLVKAVKMDFCQHCVFGPNTPKAYETLFEDVLDGDQSVFVRNDEIESEWKIIDSIKKRKLHSYKQGSDGPKELKAWSKKYKVRWRV